MGDQVMYEFRDGVGVITMDDGKANALSLQMLADLNAAVDRAEQDGAVLILAGREGRFSGGFDLKVLMSLSAETPVLHKAGFELAHRLLGYPGPVVIACTGHAIAMGVFLVLSGDYRIGIEGGDFKMVANEVALGLTMPRSAIEICRQRLTKAAFERAMLLSEVFSPDAAVAAGFLDEVVPAGELLAAARAKAESLAALDRSAVTSTKRRARAAVLESLREAIELDDADILAMVAR